MATVTHKGNTVHLDGKLPSVGDTAPNFSVVQADLSSATLDSFKGKVKVLIALPSLDTGVCQKETKEFNQRLASAKDTVVLVVSGDLPFAMKRFCSTEGVNNVITGSQFRDHGFSKAYGTFMTDGALQGLSARAVFVVDKSDKVSYVELVPDIGQEPDYQKTLDVVQKLTA